MRIHMTHHIYKFAVRNKVLDFFFLREISSAAPNIVGMVQANVGHEVTDL